MTLDVAKVAAARLWASAKLPYLSSALFACEVRAAPAGGGVTIDRSWRVAAEPDVVDALDVPELGKLLLHLTAHVVRGHADRSDAVGVHDDDRPRWNRCADAEINDDLQPAGLLPPLVPALPADLGQPDGRLVEAYFADTRGSDATAASCGAGAGGVGTSSSDAPPGLSPGQAEMLRLSVAGEITAAHRKQPGSVPAGWLRWAETLVPSTVDWRRVLAAEIRRAVAAVAGAVDYTYRRPARRTSVHTLPRPVLPALYRPVPSVAVVADTSGSMGEDELAQVLAEIDGLLRRAGLASARMPVLAVDTEVQAVRRVSAARQVQLAGGGGTDMAAGIEAASALKPRPDVIIVLTDGYTPWPDAPPRGSRVVAGIIGPLGFADSFSGGPGGPLDDVPDWARAVAIDLS